ncbi:unnamed protein product [Bathycoccus prasinos]
MCTTYQIAVLLALLFISSGTKGALAQTNDDSSGDAVAPFFGFMGAASALVFANIGAAYGTAKSGVGIASMGVMRPELVMKSVIGQSWRAFSAFTPRGMAIGIIGDAGVRANAQQPKLFVGMVLMLIFCEALALYGLIIGIILSTAGAATGGAA